MPIINIEISDEDVMRLDRVAAIERRARKHQASVLLMERVAEYESENKLPKRIAPLERTVP